MQQEATASCFLVKALVQRTGTIGIMAKAAPHNDGKRGYWRRRAAVLSPLPWAISRQQAMSFLNFFSFSRQKRREKGCFVSFL